MLMRCVPVTTGSWPSFHSVEGNFTPISSHLAFVSKWLAQHLSRSIELPRYWLVFYRVKGTFPVYSTTTGTQHLWTMHTFYPITKRTKQQQGHYCWRWHRLCLSSASRCHGLSLCFASVREFERKTKGKTSAVTTFSPLPPCPSHGSWCFWRSGDWTNVQGTASKAPPPPKYWPFDFGNFHK